MLRAEVGQTVARRRPNLGPESDRHGPNLVRNRQNLEIQQTAPGVILAKYAEGGTQERCGYDLSRCGNYHTPEYSGSRAGGPNTPQCGMFQSVSMWRNRHRPGGGMGMLGAVLRNGEERRLVHEVGCTQPFTRKSTMRPLERRPVLPGPAICCHCHMAAIGARSQRLLGRLDGVPCNGSAEHIAAMRSIPLASGGKCVDTSNKEKQADATSQHDRGKALPEPGIRDMRHQTPDIQPTSDLTDPAPIAPTSYKRPSISSTTALPARCRPQTPESYSGGALQLQEVSREESHATGLKSGHPVQPTPSRTQHKLGPTRPNSRMESAQVGPGAASLFGLVKFGRVPPRRGWSRATTYLFGSRRPQRRRRRPLSTWRHGIFMIMLPHPRAAERYDTLHFMLQAMWRVVEGNYRCREASAQGADPSATQQLTIRSRMPTANDASGNAHTRFRIRSQI